MWNQNYAVGRVSLSDSALNNEPNRIGRISLNISIATKPFCGPALPIPSGGMQTLSYFRRSHHFIRAENKGVKQDVVEHGRGKKKICASGPLQLHNRGCAHVDGCLHSAVVTSLAGAWSRDSLSLELRGACGRVRGDCASRRIMLTIRCCASVQ